MIFYFSATGNCRYVAERAAAATGERCVSITACMQAGELAFTPRDREMVGIVSPVYFWGLPSIVNAFLERLILGRPEYLWFAATYGTTTGQAGRFVSEHLRAKGLRLDARFSVRMPDSWTPMFDLSDKGRQAGLGEGAVRDVPCVPAPVSEVCHPARKKDRGAWAVCASGVCGEVRRAVCLRRHTFCRSGKKYTVRRSRGVEDAAPYGGL